MNCYHITSLPEVMDLGKQTEKGVREIRIDCAPWFTRWPGLSIRVLVNAPGSAVAYYPDTYMDGSEIVWPVSEADTVYPGEGSMEVLGEMQGVRKLSATCRTRILPSSANNTTEPPDPAAPWIEQLDEAVKRTEDALVYADRAEAAAEAAAASAVDAQIVLVNKQLCDAITGTAEIDGDTLKWDGRIADMPISTGNKYNTFCYVSDNLPTALQLAAGFELYIDNTGYGTGGAVTKVSGAQIVTDTENVTVLGTPGDSSYVYIVKKPYTSGNNEFTRAGVYFYAYSTYSHICSLQINGYTWTPASEGLTIADRYIPEGVQRVGGPLYLYDTNGKRYRIFVNTDGTLRTAVDV